MMNPRLYSGLLSALLIMAMPVIASGDAVYTEDFPDAPEGVLLKNMPGWHLNYPLSASGEGAVVTARAGYRGAGIRFSLGETFIKILPEGRGVLMEGAPVEFRFKIRLIDDAYAAAQILVGKNDGVNGLSVRFMGGKNGGVEDNMLRVSAGGENWGRGKSEDIAEARWRSEVWYEVILSNIRNTGPALNGESVTALLSVIEVANPQNVLVKDRPVSGVGAAGKFDRIDAIVIGNMGVRRVFDIDDISLQKMPGK
ncbi:MAG: hypothetical protein LBK99_15330 [Opitutaceae bacterium]|jgi:hypothetical protein|nr:hypothetical protein [Opitutaceae bacterium]